MATGNTGTTGTAGSALGAGGGTSTAGLADWAAPYITDYLGRAQALSNMPYQAYQGPLTAGASDLQTKAFQGIGNLTVPTAVTDATTRVGELLKTDIPAYSPTSFGSTFNAPGAYQTSNVTSGFNAPAAYQASNVTSGFNAPAAYQTQQFTNPFAAPSAYTTANFTNPFVAPEKYQTGTFDLAYQAPQDYTSVGGSFADAGIAGQYMNPYLKEALDPQLRELQRQSDIQRVADAGRLTQAGAFGGGRQAIMESEGRRNLLSKQSDVLGQGYATAFDKAMAQYNAEQARKIQEAQFGSEFGLKSEDVAAKYRLAAQQAAEQSRQFGAQQGLSAADIASKYGLATQQAQEQSRQFGAQQGLSAADIAAKYGLGTQQATEQSRQFGAQQGLTSAQIASQLGLDAQRINEQSRQFGSGQALTSAQIASQLGLDAQRINEQSRQFGSRLGLDSAQIAAQNALEAQKAAEASKQFGASYGLESLGKQLETAQLLGNLGISGLNAERNTLNDMLSAGTTQRAIDAEGIAADLAEFEKQRDLPFNQVKFQRDMITGLPTGSVTNEPAQLSGIAQFITAAGGIDRLLTDTGTSDLNTLLRNFGLNVGSSSGVALP